MADRFVQSHIRNLPLFEQMSAEQIRLLSTIVQVARLESGQTVFQENQPTQGMFLFVGGRGILTRRLPNGMEDRVGMVESGQYIDEEALYGEGFETASLRVIETAIVLLIPRAPFVQILTTYPEIRANVRVKTAGSAAQSEPNAEPLRETAGKLFKGQRADETVLQVWRRHWWAVARYGWIPFAVAIVMFIIALLIAESAPVLALGAAGLAVVIPGIIIAYLYYDWQDDSFVLTDQRLVRIWHHLLSFETSISEMPLDRILEVTTTIPPGDPFARLFRYGNILVKTSAEGVNILLEMIQNPMAIQAQIFTQRDRFKERTEERQRAAVRTDVQQALGLADPTPDASPQRRRSDRQDELGLPFARTRFIGANGDIVYRKHSSVWIAHIFLPLLVIVGAVGFMGFTLLFPSVVPGGVGLGVGMFALIIGLVWLYAADWDWRNDLFIIGGETITLIRQRPLWLQNEVERIRIAQIDNVRSEVSGLFNSLLNRGDVRISLIGSDAKDAKVMDNIYDPQSVQAEISERHSSIKTVRQQSDADQQRAVIKEYLQTYHEIQQTQDVTRAVPPPAAPPPVYPAATQPVSTEPPPPPPRDGSRPPRVPRSRTE